MKVAIFGKPFDLSYKSSINHLFELLQSYNINVIVHNSFSKYLISNDIASKLSTFDSYTDIKENNVSFFFSIGGDGTILEAVSYIRDLNIPLVGINVGRLGFLASVGTEAIDELVKSIVEKNYKIETRKLLRLESQPDSFNGFPYALNEITVHKKDSSSMITIHVTVGNEFLNSYWADGLLVATPTGSTAYSLSMGGPIVMPNSDNFVITPLAPHTLTVRPIVVSDKNEIILKVDSRDTNFLVSLDDRFKVFDKPTELMIVEADFKVNFLKLENDTFFVALRNKLMWGADTRN